MNDHQIMDYIERQIEMRLRSLITLGTVKSTNDAGESQLATVETHKFVERTDVEVLQPFGSPSRPKAGGLMLCFAVGGDSGHIIGIPAGVPGDRAGNLPEGAVGMNINGAKVMLNPDGSVSIGAGGAVTIKGATITLDGNVAAVNGTLTHDGKNVGKDHKHLGVTAGAAQTGNPV